jgi:hypothetical protein
MFEDTFGHSTNHEWPHGDCAPNMMASEADRILVRRRLAGQTFIQMKKKYCRSGLLVDILA